MTTDEEIIKLRQLAVSMLVDTYNESFSSIKLEIDSIVFSLIKALSQLRIVGDPSVIKKDIIDLISMDLTSDYRLIKGCNDNK